MNIEKIRLEHSMDNAEPISRVIQFWEEYCEAYERLHKPSEHLMKDYCNLMDRYSKYIQKHKHEKTE